MINALVWFWYCYDDWLAAMISTPWVGQVPFFVWLIALIASGAVVVNTK